MLDKAFVIATFIAFARAVGENPHGAYSFATHHQAAPIKQAYAAPIALNYANPAGLGAASSHHGASSYSSFSSANLVHGAPALVKTAQVAYSSPVAYASPVSHAIPNAASSYSSVSSHSQPLLVKQAHAGIAVAPQITYKTPLVQHSSPVLVKAALPVAVQAHHSYAAPIHGAQHSEHHIDYYAEPKYEFKYGVDDAHTGDKKSQHETRDGDHTQGEYSVMEPDGTVLTVQYSVQGKSGFNAVVSRSGHASHPQHAQHVPVKTVAVAPAAKIIPSIHHGGYLH